MKYTYFSVLLALFMPQNAWAEVSCADLVSKLTSVDLSRGGELINSQVGVSYTKLYKECDTSNTYNGKTLPMLGSHQLKCSTDPNRAKFILKFPDGTIMFRSKLGVDADGSPVSQSPGASPADQPQTSLKFENPPKNSVNAEEYSFVVVPQNKAGFKAKFKTDSGIGLGDLAVVIKGDKCSFGFVADQGPPYRIGEASMKTHEDLGNPQCKNVGEHPCTKLKAGGNGVGIGSDVTTIIFPGTRPTPLNEATAGQVSRQLASEKALSFLDQFQQ